MKSEEHHSLRAVEDQHWFYCGKREIAGRWIRHLKSKNLFSSSSLHFLDVGCGSGAMLLEHGNEMKISGVEVSPAALQNLRKKIVGAVTQASVLRLPFPDQSADLVTCFDVIEHVEDDALAVKEMFRILKPGGWIMINVPAYQWLWSDWDVSLGHYRRYNRRHLSDVLQKGGFEVYHCTHENFVALLPAIVVRIIRKFGKPHMLQIENKIPPTPVNQLLRWAYVWPSMGLSKILGCGLSVWAVARKAEGQKSFTTTSASSL